MVANCQYMPALCVWNSRVGKQKGEEGLEVENKKESPVT